MTEYPVKRTLIKDIDHAALGRLLREIFEDAQDEGDTWIATWGALKTVEVRLLKKGRFEANTTMDGSQSDDINAETIRRWNDFLLRATGYTAKERKKKAQEEAKKAGT